MFESIGVQLRFENNGVECVDKGINFFNSVINFKGQL